MGARPSPAESPPPDTVAAQFTDVYYGVASTSPERLVELFGADSELSHVSGITLGAKDIPSSALELPLAKKKRAEVATVDAMHTDNGGYLVLVTGMLEGSKQSPEGDLATSPADELAADDPESVQEAPDDVAIANSPDVYVSKSGGTGSPAAITDVTAETPASRIGGKGVVDGKVAEALEDDYEDDDDDDDEDGKETLNGGKDKEESIEASVGNTEAPAASSATTDENNYDHAGSTLSASTAAPESHVATGNPKDSDPPAASAETKPSVHTNGSAGPGQVPDLNRKSPVATASSSPEPSAKPSAPKSWASIVSAHGPPVAPVPVAMATHGPAVVDQQAAMSTSVPAPATSKSKPEAGTGAGQFGTGISHHSATGGKNENIAQGSASANSGGWSSVDSKRHSHNVNDGGFKTVNGHGGTFHSKHNQGRVYGPSAVIQLNSLPSDRVTKDVRALQGDFSAEFNQYGQVRNVEVKIHKGLAFVEYMTSDAVRAAVAAWADGARDSGPFKGISLAVSEKRQRRHLPGGEHPRGGGRGALRGGGRGSGGRGRGRGMPMSSTNGPGVNSSASSTPTPAS